MKKHLTDNTSLFLPYFKKIPELYELYQRNRIPDLSNHDWLILYDYLFPCHSNRYPYKEYFPITYSKSEIEIELEKKQTEVPEARYTFFSLRNGEYTIFSESIYDFLLESSFIGYLLKDITILAYQYNFIDIQPKDEMIYCARRTMALLRSFYKNTPYTRLMYAAQQHCKYVLEKKFDEMTKLSIFGDIKIYSEALVLADKTCWNISWQNDLYELYKEQLWDLLASPTAELDQIESDVDFAKKFQHEVAFLLRFSDKYFGFKVYPRITHADMIRYANLPRKIQKRSFVWLLIDWCVYKMTESITPSIFRVDQFYYARQKELFIGLLEPWINQLLTSIRLSKKKFNEMQRNEIKSEIFDEIIWKVIYEYFHLYKKTIKPTDSLFGEVRGNLLFSTITEDFIEKNPELKKKLEQDFKKLGTNLSERYKDLRWVRPSYYIREQVYKKYNPKKYRFTPKEKRDHLEIDLNKNYDLLSSNTPLDSHLNSRHVIEIEGKTYYTIEGLAYMLGCSVKTLRNMEKRGDIEFIRKHIGKRKNMRLFPSDIKEEIDRLSLLFLRNKHIAKLLGTSTRTVSRIKKKLGIEELPPLEQKIILKNFIKKSLSEHK